MQNGAANHEAVGGGDAPPASKAKPKGLIEKTYQKKSQLEHILLRPDTYIGIEHADFKLCTYFCITYY